jgi:hypothetical protein
MKNSNVTIGMQVTVSDAPDTVVYTVAEKNGFIVRLDYVTESGQKVSGGYIDTSVLRKPTKAQLQGVRISPYQKA